MEIRVSRFPHDRIADDIVDPLLTDQGIGLSRGTYELNEQITTATHEFSGPLSDYKDTGTINEVSDGKRVFRGKLTYFNQRLTIDADGKVYDPQTTIRIIRPEDL